MQFIFGSAKDLILYCFYFHNYVFLRLIQFVATYHLTTKWGVQNCREMAGRSWIGEKFGSEYLNKYNCQRETIVHHPKDHKINEKWPLLMFPPFKKYFIFRAVLDSQQNWAESREVLYTSWPLPFPNFPTITMFHQSGITVVTVNDTDIPVLSEVHSLRFIRGFNIRWILANIQYCASPIRVWYKWCSALNVQCLWLFISPSSLIPGKH